jgi:hypothetical protein
MATESEILQHLTTTPPVVSRLANNIPKPTWEVPPVQKTVYSFPSMEPLRFVEYSLGILNDYTTHKDRKNDCVLSYS